MKIYNNLKIIERIPVIQQYRLFKDRLDNPKILGIIFSFTLLLLLSITFLFSVVNAIEVKADFNGDGNDDLAVGVPDEDIGYPLSISDAGAVQVLYGSPVGLSATYQIDDQFWTQNSTDIENQVESGDVFGQALAIGDFNADGKDDLSVGVPYEDLDSIGNTGGVEVIYGSSNGLSATLVHADQFWTQDSTDIDDSAEAEDHFAVSLR